MHLPMSVLSPYCQHLEVHSYIAFRLHDGTFEPQKTFTLEETPFGAALKLVIEDVSKQYRGGHRALSNFSLTIKPGILGLLGPNGAGKTTLMGILATITKANEGRVLWNETEIAKNPNTLRSVLGYLPQDFGVYPNLNAVEFLEYLAAVKGLDKATAARRIPELLELVNLTDARKRALGGYSGGMKQRVGIAQALLNDPQLLIVDEPTAGLDPEERVPLRPTDGGQDIALRLVVSYSVIP
jgi:ABC-2 type transport system ATP-binding protein